MSNCVVIIVSADGLAPLGARPSAGTVIINTDLVCHINLELALEEVLLYIWNMRCVDIRLKFLAMLRFLKIVAWSATCM